MPVRDREDEEFSGKVALITGGSSGIGYAVVALLAARGASVAFCADDFTCVERVEREFNGAGFEVLGIAADVANGADARRFVDETVKRFGGLDMLANCAGIRQPGNVVDLEESAWDRVMNVNVKGMYLSAKYAIPKMRLRGGGSIVNVSSTQAYVCRPNVAAYVAGKGAINALTRAMALDHAADRIRVNTVCPGLVDTPLVRGALSTMPGPQSIDEMIHERAMSHPLGRAYGRACTATEVAEVIAFLLGERSSFVSGAAYTVDGALTVQAMG